MSKDTQITSVGHKPCAMEGHQVGGLKTMVVRAASWILASYTQNSNPTDCGSQIHVRKRLP